MRVISKVEYKDKFVVKGMNLEGLRQIGVLFELSKHFVVSPPQELFFQGAATSIHSSRMVLNELSYFDGLFCPITVSGGIRSLQDIERFLKSGADRVGVNTALFDDTSLLKQMSDRFGASTIVVCIDVDFVGGDFYCFTHNGRENSGVLISEWLKRINSIDSFEVLVTSIRKDGTFGGFDLELKDRFQTHSGPVILSGGYHPKYQDQISKLGVDGVAIASSFHADFMQTHMLSSTELSLAARHDFSLQRFKAVEAKATPTFVSSKIESTYK